MLEHFRGLNTNLNTLHTVSSYVERATGLSGGYIQIGKLVIVDISFTSLYESGNQLYGFPLSNGTWFELNALAVASGVTIPARGIIVGDYVVIGVPNSTLNLEYRVTGCYIAK